MTTGNLFFPEGLEEAVVMLLLKKPSLDPVDPVSYCLESFISGKSN